MRLRAETAAARAAAAQPAAPAPAPAALLLRLQQTAGNRAVTTLLARERTGRRDRRRERERERERARARRPREDRERQRDRERHAARDDRQGRREDPDAWGERGRVGPDELDHAQRLRRFHRGGRTMRFSPSTEPPMYDVRYWTCTVIVTDDQDVQTRIPFTPAVGRNWANLYANSEDIDLEFRLKPGASPSEAVRAIYADGERWAMDCIDYLVAARLFAELDATGDAAFDQKYSNLGGPMMIAQHHTPGLGSEEFWERSGQGEEFESTRNGGAPTKTGESPSSIEEEDELLASLPVGTRVMWSTNLDDEDEDWVNENTLKVGPNRYLAHPHGILSATQLRREMVDEDLERAERDRAIAQHVFIAEIEWYPRP